MRALGFYSWACEGAALLDMGDALCFSEPTADFADAILREEAAAVLYAALVAAGVL
jgi:hypothetical protein